MPSVFDYTAGFVCKDVSPANTAHQRMITTQVGSTSGASTKTLHASVQYIEDHVPAMWMLENVINLKAITLVSSMLRTRLCAKGYAIRCFLVNSRSFGAPTSRSRVFFLGIHVGKLEVFDMGNWDGFLYDMACAIPPLDVHDRAFVRTQFRSTTPSARFVFWHSRCVLCAFAFVVWHSRRAICAIAFCAALRTVCFRTTPRRCSSCTKSPAR